MKPFVTPDLTIRKSREALVDPSRRRMRGRAAQHLLTALLSMAANVRKIRVFMEAQGTSKREAAQSTASSKSQEGVDH